MPRAGSRLSARHLLGRIALLLLGMSSLAAAQVTVLTYNVWFDDASGRAERYPAIVRYLAASAADVICLQEVTEAFAVDVAAFAKSTGYHLASDQRLPGYGTVILGRSPLSGIEVIALPTRMGRQGLRCTTTLAGRAVQVTTAHLDSLPTDTQRRIEQMRLLGAGATAPALWLGDFNFGDAEPEQAELARWLDFGLADPRPTYDPLANPLAATTAFADEPRRRLDRVLGLGTWTLARFRVDAACGLSDHHPVLVTLEAGD